MLITDYTLEWTALNEATITWAGGATDVYWTIYVNGKVLDQFEDSGSISKTISLREDDNHTIAIVKSSTIPLEAMPSPEAAVLLRPTVRWVRVPAASSYVLYFVDANDSNYEYILDTIFADEDSPDVYEWRFPSDLEFAGEDVVRVKVVAEGSFGTAAAPSIVSGFVGGHPAHAYSITSGDGSVLTIDRER